MTYVHEPQDGWMTLCTQTQDLLPNGYNYDGAHFNDVHPGKTQADAEFVAARLDYPTHHRYCPRGPHRVAYVIHERLTPTERLID